MFEKEEQLRGVWIVIVNEDVCLFMRMGNLIIETVILVD